MVLPLGRSQTRRVFSDHLEEGGFTSFNQGRRINRLIVTQVWRFSTAFGTVNEWKFANIASMADHLKRCKFNTIARREEAIPLPCMCFTRELTKEGRCLRSVLKPVA